MQREARMLQEMREQARLQAANEAAEAERRRVELEQRNAALKMVRRNWEYFHHHSQYLFFSSSSS